jgi:nitroimidazol reductase NimA-like FMN-containing flavoprotein (pyridoxamine 5'-phosphate oxidase superfamily)
LAFRSRRRLKRREARQNLLVSDNVRTRGHIPWNKIDARLRSMREIWVATADAAGRADAVPVWFWWDGSSVWFTTKASSRKARNIAVRPEVVLHNGDGADPIIVKGRAQLVDAEDELVRLDLAYAEKYVDPHSGTKATIFVEGDVAFRVRPRLVMAWEYATCANRTDWRFEPALSSG